MRFRSLLVALLFFCLAFASAWAQKGEKAPSSKTSKAVPKTAQTKPDSVWFEFKQTGNQVVADLFLFNDQPLAGGQIPLRFGNGKAPLTVDSVQFDPKRAGKFDFKNGGIDSVNQTMRIGFISDLSGRKPPLEPGRGKLLTIFFSLKSDKPYEMVLDTLTLPGGYAFLLADVSAQTTPALFKTGKFKTK